MHIHLAKHMHKRTTKKDSCAYDGKYRGLCFPPQGTNDLKRNDGSVLLHGLGGQVAFHLHISNNCSLIYKNG